MTIPLRGKLSYIWASLMEQDRIYSHVFEEAGTAHADDVTSHWAEARPMKRRPDRYEVWLHARAQSGTPEYRHIPLSARAGSGPLRRAEALSAIGDLERIWMMNRHFSLACEQPFMKYVETQLVYPPPPDIAPKAALKKDAARGKLADVIDIRTGKRRPR